MTGIFSTADESRLRKVSRVVIATGTAAIVVGKECDDVAFVATNTLGRIKKYQEQYMGISTTNLRLHSGLRHRCLACGYDIK
ncbi:hypothetical protein DPMN_000480 [Dreissena polymorpha]|uniref:Uncharacterized protein n=1 Tax=Dreissena polymorpha TaxID=45954 RepID=A0A9D4MGR7_DREPO|nr:hypothetical protein DPMN_000480 [Dreissena polymorpha]